MPVGTSAYVPLANVTLGSSAATVTFSSISQSYRDLVLVTSVNVSVSGNSGLIKINNDAGANYNMVWMGGNGLNAFSGSIASTSTPYIPYTGSFENGTNFIMNFMDYSATDKHKIVLTRFNLASAYTIAQPIRWANTSAITSIQINSNSTFTSGSTFALYGVNA